MFTEGLFIVTQEKAEYLGTEIVRLVDETVGICGIFLNSALDSPPKI